MEHGLRLTHNWNRNILLKGVLMCVILLFSLWYHEYDAIINVMLAVVFCLIFLSTRTFEDTAKPFETYLLMLEYGIAFMIMVSLCSIGSNNKMAAAGIVMIFLSSFVFLSVLLRKYCHIQQARWLHPVFATHWELYTGMICIIVCLLSMVQMNLCLMGAFSLFCAQLYYYLSTQKRTFFIKR